MSVDRHTGIVTLAQGKCDKCKVHHLWPEGTPRVRDAKCPDCGEQLKRTTHLCGYSKKQWMAGLGDPSGPTSERRA